MKTAIQVTTELEVKIFDLGDDTLSALQKGVGGYIEPVDLANKLTMWVNEESKLNGSAHNAIASAWWNAIHPDYFDLMFGDVVFTGGTDEEGNTLGLTAADVTFLTNLFEEWSR